jgi:hypothetical protein
MRDTTRHFSLNLRRENEFLAAMRRDWFEEQERVWSDTQNQESVMSFVSVWLERRQSEESIMGSVNEWLQGRHIEQERVISMVKEWPAWRQSEQAGNELSDCSEDSKQVCN